MTGLCILSVYQVTSDSIFNQSWTKLVENFILLSWTGSMYLAGLCSNHSSYGGLFTEPIQVNVYTPFSH